jgi:LysR family transcriptional regulator, regulator for bpeEF and oprC
MDQLAAMRAFIRIVDSGSFSRAAHSLDQPKATITRHIQLLEAHLRTRLLNRTTRRVTVTTDGAAYYERTQRLLAELDELDGSMTLSMVQPRGRLRIDVTAATAQAVILPALADFLELYPDIQLDMGISDRPADLIAENVDCVIRGGVLSDQSLTARRIADLPMLLCAAPAYVERHGLPAHPAELDTTHHLVGYFSAGGGRSRPLVFTRGEERVEVRGRRYRVAANEVGICLLSGLAGHGVVETTLFLARPHLLAGRLVPVLPGWRLESLPLHVVYPPNRHLNNKTRVFVDWVAGLFAASEFAPPSAGELRGLGILPAAE